MAKQSDKTMLLLLGCLVLLIVVCALCIAGGFFLPYRLWTKSSPTETARTFLKENPAVKEHLGEVKDFGWLPSGSYNETNGKGDAHLQFSLKGTKADGNAELKMAKEPGKDWKVTWGELDVGGTKFDLMGAPAPPPEKPEGGSTPRANPPANPPANTPAEQDGGSATA